MCKSNNKHSKPNLQLLFYFCFPSPVDALLNKSINPVILALDLSSKVVLWREAS